MNLSFIEFLITRLTSWPVVTLLIALMYRGLLEGMVRFVMVTNLPIAEREALIKHAREQAS